MHFLGMQLPKPGTKRLVLGVVHDGTTVVDTFEHIPNPDHDEAQQCRDALDAVRTILTAHSISACALLEADYNQRARVVAGTKQAMGVQDRTTGWIHYGYRYYNPRTGSFTQQDTLDAPLDPLNGNRYAFAGNDPINNTDPTGMWSWGDAWDKLKGGASKCLRGGATAVGGTLAGTLVVNVVSGIATGGTSVFIGLGNYGVIGIAGCVGALSG